MAVALHSSLAMSATPAQARISSERGLSARVDHFIAEPRFASAAWGIAVVSLDSGETVYAHDAHKLLTPASTAKLFTAALALDTFADEHRVATTLFATAKHGRDGELRGDVVLVGYGDPSLGVDKRVSWADTLAIELRKSGVTLVRGDLIADATWFAAPLFGNGWEAADLQSWFGAPASALSVDENVVRIEISPAAQPGARARVRFDPPASAPMLVNGIRTLASRTITDISLIRRPGESTLHAFGTIARDAGVQSYRIALDDPARVAGEQLRAALLRQGVTVAGKVRSVYWPDVDDALDSAKLERIATIWSPSITEIVTRGMKISQNLYMHNLLLLVGADAHANDLAAGTDTSRFRSSESRGIDALQRFLPSIGVSPDEVLIEDGAGLSRRNLVSAYAMVRLLVHHGSAPEHSAFRTALPEAGVDGSLTGRLRGSPAQGRVHAKTGSMRFTYSLAGYALSASNERLAFAILLNNYDAPAGSARASAELDAITLMLVADTKATSRPAPAATRKTR
ncbi:MAG: D-alanyl-D-alanine carboxypeptidase/D-alanyl-D-alanine-endopeptidase [Dokdonella sp.]